MTFKIVKVHFGIGNQHQWYYGYGQHDMCHQNKVINKFYGALAAKISCFRSYGSAGASPSLFQRAVNAEISIPAATETLSELTGV